MMLGKRLAIRAALTGPLLSALAFQATAEEIEWESWRVGVCHVQQQNGRFAQFGAPYRTSADKLEGRQASSYESKVMGLRVLAIDGIENPGWDDIVKVARQDLYLEEGRLTFTTEINGVRQERELPACVEITTANGETLIPGWDRVIAILMMDTLSEILFKKDGLWKPELRGGKLVIMEDKKHHYFTDQAIMEFHELGPGRIAAAFYIDEENLFVMEKLLNARGLNYKTLDGGDDSRDGIRRVVVYHSWVAEQKSYNFYAFMSSMRTLYFDYLEDLRPILNRRVQEAEDDLRRKYGR